MELTYFGVSWYIYTSFFWGENLENFLLLIFKRIFTKTADRFQPLSSPHHQGLGSPPLPPVEACRYVEVVQTLFRRDRGTGVVEFGKEMVGFQGSEKMGLSCLWWVNQSEAWRIHGLRKKNLLDAFFAEKNRVHQRNSAFTCALFWRWWVKTWPELKGFWG